MVAGWRRRLGRLVAAGGVAFLLAHFAGHWPRRVPLRLDLGEEHRGYTEARIEVRAAEDGARMHGARLRFAQGAPRALEHAVELPPGDYELQVELNGPEGRRAEARQRLQVPAEGVVRVGVTEGAR